MVVRGSEIHPEYISFEICVCLGCVSVGGVRPPQLLGSNIFDVLDCGPLLFVVHLYSMVSKQCVEV